ncbi:hypothetical protein [uncultured Ruegeria sp.]|uniref:hypothetical protein n=1 Tax=uncultured Ruegeria sp. TaxID=259304 RepID=UPI0026234F07|nr:hypothetical protein [uncultured Ruegeria sp.]
MSLGHSFSKVFGLSSNTLRSLGVFDPTLDVDARLFIDPFLLPHSQHKEFSDCAFTKYEEHFTGIYSLITHSRTEGDKAWKAALKKFQFSEAKGMSGTCLGYSKTSTKGHAFGPIKAAQSLRWAKQVIELGVKDPEMFSALSLFEEGIGADLISDMIAAIAIECILKFNERVISEISKETPIPLQEFTLRGHKAMLPQNPFSNQPEPVILLADDILKNLPILDDPKNIPKVVEGNENLRDRVNEHIGEVFATKTKKDKEHIKDRAMESSAAFQTFLDMLKLLEQSNYNVYQDPEGLLAWRDIAASTTAINKLHLVVDNSLPRLERLNKVVLSIIEKFTALVEDNRLYRVFYHEDKPRKESFAQLLFYAIASSYCDAADVGLTAEADAGVGPVDFKFSDGADSVLVEVKLSTNSSTVKGFTNQLEAYNKAERSGYGHYLVIDVGKLGNKWKSLQTIAAENPEFANTNKLHLVDGNLKQSASKRAT